MLYGHHGRGVGPVNVGALRTRMVTGDVGVTDVSLAAIRDSSVAIPAPRSAALRPSVSSMEISMSWESSGVQACT